MALITLLMFVALLPCFAHSDKVSDGIVNGTEAIEHSRPYMVSVQKIPANRVLPEHTCGGFLVSDRFVMTAAHCWKYGENLTVVLGAHDLYDGKINYTRMAVKFYHIYPAYDRKDSDIMLLQLDGKVKISLEINFIDLINKTNTDIKANSICSVSGWGDKTNGDRYHSKKLMEVNVTVKNQSECKEVWRGKFKIPRMMCAGGQGGFCKGDSGGPLVCNGTAVGVVAFYQKNECEHPIKPNVYTKISGFLPWIHGVIYSVY